MEKMAFLCLAIERAFKRDYMRKVHKIINIALIFTLGIGGLCVEHGYALRPPLATRETAKKKNGTSLQIAILQQMAWLALDNRENSEVSVKDLLQFYSYSASCRNFIDNAGRVVEHLRKKPCVSAQEVMNELGLTKAELAAIYKIIQRSDAIQARLRDSDNYGYINVVDKYAVKGWFRLVFHPGTSCPYKCPFCKSVKIDKNGERRVRKYPYTKKDMVAESTLRRAVRSLGAMRKIGKKPYISIAGGLEPASPEG